MPDANRLDRDRIARGVVYLEAYWDTPKMLELDQYSLMETQLAALDLSDRELRFLKVNLPRDREWMTPQARKVEICRQCLELLEITNEDQ